MVGVTTLIGAVSETELFRHLAGITREVRLSGTPEEARAFDYAEEQLRAFGFAVQRHASNALIGYPLRASLSVLGDEEIAIAANGYSLSASTPDGGVVGELVFVGADLSESAADADLQGKIVISNGLATPGQAMAARTAKAAGHIHVNDEHIHEMCISPVWGTPTLATGDLLPAVPAVGVTRMDGERLLNLLRKGPVRVRLTTQPFRAWVQIPTLIADLPGTASDTFVLFSGHVDSWHYGVMDNGTANASQLEVARLMSERRALLRRGLRIALWSGHSHGRYAGSTWYADHAWHELHRRCACHVNIDSVGAVGASILEEAPTMAETWQSGRAILSDTVGCDLAYRRISRSSDQSFWGHGIPSLFASLSEQPADNSATGSALATLLGGTGKSGGLGWWWHTTEDMLDKIDARNLVRDAGIYSETIWRLCTAVRLPFEAAAGARAIGEAVERYAATAGSALDLHRTAALAREVATVVEERVASSTDEEANAITWEVTRALIPVNYTRSGPFDQDLALRSVPVPGLSEIAELANAPMGSDRFYFALTSFARERNRVEAALHQAADAASRKTADTDSTPG
jgi:hypothetical protein